ncbi:MAG: hypothetical protein ACQER9_03755 [Nanobdellota archaeon]
MKKQKDFKKYMKKNFLKFYGFEVLSFFLIMLTLLIFASPLQDSALKVSQEYKEFQSGIEYFDPSTEDFDKMENFSSSLNQNKKLDNTINNFTLIITTMFLIIILLYSISHTFQIKTIKKQKYFKLLYKNFGLSLILLISFILIFWIYSGLFYFLALNKIITSILFFLIFFLFIFIFFFLTRKEPKIKISGKKYIRLITTLLASFAVIYFLLNLTVNLIGYSTSTSSFFITLGLNLLIILFIIPLVMALAKLIFNYY